MHGRTEEETRAAQHRAWIEAEVRKTRHNKYHEARAAGFGEADAELHADQAAEIRRKEIEG